MNLETIQLPHGYTATVATDESPQNPFADFEDMPIATLYESRFQSPGKQDAPELLDLFDRIPAGKFRTAKGREKIAGLAGIDLSDVEPPEPGNRNSDTWKDALREALPETPGHYHGWTSATAYFECMEAVAGLLGIPCYFGTSRGYCQGDAALVFTIALPEWRERVGAPADCADQCKGVFDLYTSWAWGDCYGIQSVNRPGTVDADGDPVEGEEVPGADCWGFYGKHENSGLLDHCRETVESDREWLAREAVESLDAACRDIATV